MIDMKMTYSIPCLKAFTGSLLLGSLFAGTASVPGAVVLSENFIAGQRLVQDLPNTSAWYLTGGGTGTVPIWENPAGMLTIDMTANAQILAYFTDGAPISLAVGEFLEISFSFQMTNAVSQGVGVRTAVMNSSGGERITGDASGTSLSEFNGYTGYGGWFNPGGSPTTIRERDPANNALLSTAGVWTTQETRSGNINILNDNVYIGSYLIERPVDSVHVTFGLSGPNFTGFTFTYDEGTLTSFDTFGIWLNQNAGDAFSLTGFDVTYVPEPSTYVLAFGIAAGALLLIRRRRGDRS